MKTCLIRLGPAVTPETLDNVGPERDIYDRLELCTRSKVTEDGHLALVPDAPVLVDHDPDQQVGRIVRLHTWPDALGSWWFARCEISDPPPWLRVRTDASICFSALSRGEAAGRSVVRNALVREVSILTPGKRPAEPFAKVLSLEDVAEHVPSPVVSLPARTKSRSQRDLDELHRRIEAAGDNADVEAIIVAMKLEKGLVTPFELMGLPA